jgi:hypothetical protein
MMGRGIDRGVLVNRVVWQASWEAVWQGLRLDDRALRKRLNLPELPLRGPSPVIFLQPVGDRLGRLPVRVTTLAGTIDRTNQWQDVTVGWWKRERQVSQEIRWVILC